MPPETDAQLLSRCRNSSIGVLSQGSKEAGAILSQLQTPDGKYLLYGIDSSSTAPNNATPEQVAISKVQGHTEVFESPTAHIEIFVRDPSERQTLAASRCIIMTEDAFEESRGHARAFSAITRIVSEKSTDRCFRNLSLGSTVFSIVAETVKNNIAARNEARREETRLGNNVESASVMGYFLFSPEGKEAIYHLGVMLLVEQLPASIGSYLKPEKDGLPSPTLCRLDHESHVVGVHRTSAGLLEGEHFEYRKVMQA